MADDTVNITISCAREGAPGERRVALTPSVVPQLAKLGARVLIEHGAGESAGFPDSAYTEKGAEIADRDRIFRETDVLCQLDPIHLAEHLTRPMTVIGMIDPLSRPEDARRFAEAGARSFALELMPRITRAQSMDVLSSQATVAGYKAVLVATEFLPRMFPMLMTAAGTVTAARVLVIGAGVAGLQAISTARRLGAVVSGYDIRPAVKEQIESLGASFVELEIDAGAAEDKGGYAKEMGEEFYRKQQEALAEVVRRQDVVITTAAVPGKQAPKLLTEEMITGMPLGSVIIDLAAPRGGNCTLTKCGEIVHVHGVTIVGPENIVAAVPYHASDMYARNVATFLAHLVADGAIRDDRTDEIIGETMVTDGGEVVQPRVREALGLPVEEAAAAAGKESSDG